jgi:homoserine kinase type II
MSGAQFWRIDARTGVDGSQVMRRAPDPAPACTLILRRWPIEHPTPQRLQFIHAVLDHLARRGLSFIPAPIRTANGESFLHHAGHLWELAPWMPGTADYEHSPSTEKLRAAMIALAQIHVSAREFPLTAPQQVARAAPAISRRLARLHELTAGTQQQLLGVINESIWPELAPLARKFLTALPNAIPRALARLEPLKTISLPPQPCLRDIWHDHVLFTGNEVTGVIDFGALDIDIPATDIARLLGSLLGNDRAAWQIGLDAYAAVRPLSLDERQAATALDISGILLAGCNWIRWIYIERRRFENRAQVVGRFRMIVSRVARMSE